MSENPKSFEHQRHKPPTTLTHPRDLVLCCAPIRSNVNLSNMVRTAGCCGITRVIACGSPKIDKTIARDGAEPSRSASANTASPPVLAAASGKRGHVGQRGDLAWEPVSISASPTPKGASRIRSASRAHYMRGRTICGPCDWYLPALSA